MGVTQSSKTFLAADLVVSRSHIKSAVKRVLRGVLHKRSIIEVGLDVSAVVSEDYIQSHMRANAEGVMRYVMGHAPYSDALMHVMRERGVKVIFVIRDPRAALLSWAYYIHEEPRHFAHLAQKEKSLQERMKAILSGGRVGGLYIESYSSILRRLKGWMDQPDVLIVRFEDLVGPKGNGSRAQQLMALERIGECVGYAKNQLGDIADHLFGGTSTFRVGKIDTWREELSGEMLNGFIQQCGKYMADFGYQEV